MNMNRDMIRDQAKVNAAQTTYRDLLHASGIEAKLISDTISTGLLDGLRQGNSLLQITKSLFKSVLNTIAETIIKKTIELQIEKLFEFLGSKNLQLKNKLLQKRLNN